jgi:hypothetical protein
MTVTALVPVLLGSAGSESLFPHPAGLSYSNMVLRYV